MAQRPPASPNHLAPPAVTGLEGGRKAAGKRNRNKRRKQRFTSVVMITLLVSVVAGAGYIGYTMWGEQQAADEAENERRQAEIEAERQRRTTEDLIVELRDAPRWNGPGAPAFGIGDDAGIEITDGNVDG